MDVVGRGWVVVEVAGSAVEGARPTVELADDGRAYGSTAVNRWTGSYTLEGDVLAVGPAATTRMAGPEDAMATESAFLSALQQPLHVAEQGADRVVLTDPDGGAVLVLAPAPAPDEVVAADPGTS